MLLQCVQMFRHAGVKYSSRCEVGISWSKVSAVVNIHLSAL